MTQAQPSTASSSAAARTLAYSKPDRSPWSMLARAMSAVALALGLLQLLCSVGQYAPSLASIWRQWDGNIDTLVLLVGEAVADVAAVGLIVAAGACDRFREWGRRAVVYSSVTFTFGLILQVMIRIVDYSKMALATPRFGMSNLSFFVFSTLGKTGIELLAPLLLIWLLQLPEVKERFAPLTGESSV